MRALLLGVRALLLGNYSGALGPTEVRYAELLTFAKAAQVSAQFDGAPTLGWSRPNELSTTYCAAPLAAPGAASFDVWAVGMDCCNDARGFTCWEETQTSQSPPHGPASDADAALLPGDGRVGLKVDREDKEPFLRAAKRSAAWWHGRTDASPEPLLVYLVSRTVNRCATKPLVVCGDGKTEQSCPSPIDKAFDLDCPGIEKCMRAWSPSANTFKHVCAPRPFNRRYMNAPVGNGTGTNTTDWWDEYREDHPNHPAGEPGDDWWGLVRRANSSNSSNSSEVEAAQA